MAELVSNEYMKRKSLKQALFAVELIENLYEQYSNAIPLCLELKELLSNKSLYNPVNDKNDLEKFKQAHKALHDWVTYNRIRVRNLIDACGYDNLGDIMQVGSEAVLGLEVEGDKQQELLAKYDS